MRANKTYVATMAAVAGLTLALRAQSYQPTSTTEVYSSLKNSIVLTGEKPWHYPWFRIDIPFQFSYFNQKMDSVYIGNCGLFFTLDKKDVITAGPAEMEDKGSTLSESPIAYSIEGKKGHRILKVEWKNTGFSGDTNKADFYNAQVWLMEETGAIEIHVGPWHLSELPLPDGPSISIPGVVLRNYDGQEFTAPGSDHNGRGEMKTNDKGGKNSHKIPRVVYRFTTLSRNSASCKN